MFPIPPDVASWVAVAAAAVAAVALIVALGAQLRLTRLRRSLLTLRGQAGDGDVLQVAARQSAELVQLRGQLADVSRQLDVARQDVASSLRHVAVVRYDAFEDMGGRMSFSAAVVDDAGDGLVVSSICGRAESRTYAKGIVGGSSDLALSDDEQQALQLARGRQPAVSKERR